MPPDLSREQMARRWCEGLTGSTVKYDVSCPDPDRFYGHCETRIIGSMVLTTAEANAITVSRRREHIATDGQNSLLFFANRSDGVLGSQQLGRSTTLHRGGATLLDLTEPYHTFGKRNGAALAFYVDRASVQRAGLDIGAITGRALDPGSDALRLLMQYLRLQMKLDVVTNPDVGLLVARHMADLLVLALGGRNLDRAGEDSDGAAHARLLAARDIISRLAHDPTLSAESIGGKLGLSARSVQHVMQRHGTTLSDELSVARVRRAMALLRSTGKSDRRILDIALDVGFRDLSTFYRAFRRHFGCAPSDVRSKRSRRQKTPGD